MTGPEAIAAAERLTVERALAFVAEFKGDARCALNCQHSEALASEVFRLRAALLQSQEALQACDSFLKNIEWNDSTSENQACDLREQIRQAALLSSPVAPKEQRTS